MTRRPTRRAPARVALAIAALLLVAGALWTPVASAQEPADQGSIGIRLLDVPTDRAADPRARTYIVDHVEPGASISRRVEVANTGAEPRRLAVSTGAATIEDGQMQFGADGATNELTGWTTLDREAVELGPDATETVTVVIDVPADAAPGERYAVVWAAASSDPAEGEITTVNRVGVRIYLSVGGDNEPASDFAISTIEGRRDEDGAALVAATIENTGGRALDLSGELSLTDGPGGLSAGPFDTQGATTLGVGQTGTVLVPLDDAVPAGEWHADLIVRSGTVEREATATISIPEAPATSGGAVAPDEDDGSGWLVPVAIAVGAAVVVVGAGGAFLALRRRPGPIGEPA